MKKAKAKPPIRRIGPDMNIHELQPGYRLVAPRKGIHYLIVKVTKTKVFARLRKGDQGRWGEALVEVIPAEVFGYKIVEAAV